VNQPNAATAIDVASMPWAFTQHQPLDTSAFIAEAEKRGVDLDIPTLRELYRHGLLIPFVQITYRAVRPPATPDPSELPLGGTQLMDLRSARDTGRLRDLSALPSQARLPFELSKETWPKAWRGLLYSWYQLLALPSLGNVLAERKCQQRGQQRIARLPKPEQALLDRAEKLRNWSSPSPRSRPATCLTSIPSGWS
jgi:hypothetical protein